jgi:endonuclease YncB( thermonuclease family)
VRQGLLIAVALAIPPVFPAVAQGVQPNHAAIRPLPYQLFGRVRVIDGRTIEFIREKTTVRIAGYEASELDQIATTDNFDWPAGQVARAWMILRTLRQDVNCAPLQYDSDGSVLAHCFVGDTNLAASAISEGIGYAFNYSGEPGVPAYFDLERRARGLGLGVWSAAGLAPPWQYRKAKAIRHDDQHVTADDPAGSLPLPPPTGTIHRNTTQ